MNIYLFILFGFIILYMFKIMCNRIEGLDCGYGCIEISTNDREINKMRALLDQETAEKNANNRRAGECKEKLDECNWHLSNCRS